MTRFRHGAAVIGSLIFTLATVGCSGDSARLVPTEGIVLIDGKPAANIAVQFMPDVVKGGKGPTSFGTTDAEGRFRLQTNDGQSGAVVGPHLVTLVDQEEERTPQGSTTTKLPRLDPRLTMSTSGLPVEVTGANQPIKLEVARFRGLE